MQKNIQLAQGSHIIRISRYVGLVELCVGLVYPKYRKPYFKQAPMHHQFSSEHMGFKAS